MKVGDVVISRHGPYSTKAPLVCGSGVYTHAICVSVEPFVCVSEEGDMMWSCLTQSDYMGLCQAHPDACKAAFVRYGKQPTQETRSDTRQPQHQHGPDCLCFDCTKRYL